MRHMIAALLVSASALSAQFPTGPTPPTNPTTRGGAEFRVSGFMIAGDRSLDFANTLSTDTGSIVGFDVLLRAEAMGIYVRSMTGEFGDGRHVTSADARLYLFPQEFSIFGGAARRALWSNLNADAPTTFDVGVGGVSITVNIGASGLRTNLTGAYYFPVGESSTRIKNGMEGEASLMYVFPKVPFFIQAGYRTEVFTQKSGTQLTPEEVRGIRIGGGLQLGGR